MNAKKKKILKVTAIILVALGVISLALFFMSFIGANMSWVTNYQPLNLNSAKLALDEESGYYTFTMDENRDFRVMQITDVHIGGGVFSKSRDKLALDAVYKLIKDAKPDLVVFTGDMVYPAFFQTSSHNNLNQLKALGSFMETINVRWAAVFGNHDAESAARYNKEKLVDYLESLNTCLFQRGPDNIKGMGNYIIDIRNPNGSINSSLVLMDSNMYAKQNGKKVYDKIADNQIAWYQEEMAKLEVRAGKIVPSHLFIHIPLQQYKISYDMYLNSNEEVKYYFGDRREDECASPFSNNLFEKMVELQSTKAVYCGHDHVNTYSVEYKGIRLTYGMSIDYIAYGGIKKMTEQRGSTLIDIKSDSSFSITPRKLVDIG